MSKQPKPERRTDVALNATNVISSFYRTDAEPDDASKPADTEPVIAASGKTEIQTLIEAVEAIDRPTPPPSTTHVRNPAEGLSRFRELVAAVKAKRRKP